MLPFTLCVCTFVSLLDCHTLCVTFNSNSGMGLTQTTVTPTNVGSSSSSDHSGGHLEGRYIVFLLMHITLYTSAGVFVHNHEYVPITYAGRMTVLESEVGGGIKAQMNEILGLIHSQNRNQEQVEWEVDEELDSLLSSFSFNSDSGKNQIANSTFYGFNKPPCYALSSSQVPQCTT